MAPAAQRLQAGVANMERNLAGGALSGVEVKELQDLYGQLRGIAGPANDAGAEADTDAVLRKALEGKGVTNPDQQNILLRAAKRQVNTSNGIQFRPGAAVPAVANTQGGAPQPRGAGQGQPQPPTSGQ